MTSEPTQDKDEEVRRLQGCISDMVSLLALPAMWSGREPADIITTLLDVLLSMLRLDFACVRLSDHAGNTVADEVRAAHGSDTQERLREITQLLETCLSDDSHTPALRFPKPRGGGAVSIARLKLGVQKETGALIAGSDREDFPTEIETLILRVAANQAAIALQEARLIGERKRAEKEL